MIVEIIHNKGFYPVGAPCGSGIATGSVSKWEIVV